MSAIVVIISGGISFLCLSIGMFAINGWLGLASIFAAICAVSILVFNEGRDRHYNEFLNKRHQEILEEIADIRGRF